MEIVRIAYEGWNRDDLDRALSVIHPDAEWSAGGVPDLFLGLEPVYRGHAGVREWWTFVKEPWEYFQSHIERVVEEGDKVVTAVRFEAVGKGSGVTVGLPLANVWELEDGLIVKFASYYTFEEALEAAGLSE